MSKPDTTPSKPARVFKNSDANRKAIKDSIEQFRTYSMLTKSEYPTKAQKNALAYFLTPMSNSKE